MINIKTHLDNITQKSKVDLGHQSAIDNICRIAAGVEASNVETEYQGFGTSSNVANRAIDIFIEIERQYLKAIQPSTEKEVPTND